jgi:hypothetical protein
MKNCCHHVTEAKNSAYTKFRLIRKKRGRRAHSKNGVLGVRRGSGFQQLNDINLVLPWALGDGHIYESLRSLDPG